jgi:hypothetical protein
MGDGYISAAVVFAIAGAWSYTAFDTVEAGVAARGKRVAGSWLRFSPVDVLCCIAAPVVPFGPLAVPA